MLCLKTLPLRLLIFLRFRNNFIIFSRYPFISNPQNLDAVSWFRIPHDVHIYMKFCIRTEMPNVASSQVISVQRRYTLRILRPVLNFIMFQSTGIYTIRSKVSGRLLETLIRLSLWHTSQSWTLVLGVPTLWLYNSSNSVRRTFCQVTELLWPIGRPFFLQSCS
jgi:hypothetical protein